MYSNNDIPTSIDHFRVGDRVRVVSYGDATRLQDVGRTGTVVKKARVNLTVEWEHPMAGEPKQRALWFRTLRVHNV